MSKVKSYLETATNIAVILGALAVSGVFLLNYLRPNEQRTPRLRAGFQKGHQLPPIPGVSYNEAPQTLLIALNTSCAFCTESVPFYNQLAEAQLKSKSSIRIMTVFPNAEKEVQQYVQTHQLRLASRAAIDLQSLNVMGTPTMLLIDEKGTIVDFWIGKPSEATQRQVMKQVTL
jgi:hypothetical protein